MNLKRTAAAFCAVFAAFSMTFGVSAENENGAYDSGVTSDDSYSQEVYDNEDAPQWEAQAEEPSETDAAESWEDGAAEYAQTSAAQTEAPAETTTTTQYVTTLVPDRPTSAPSTVEIEVGEIKDGEFSAKINIDSDSLISNASMSVSYDPALLEYIGCEHNEDAGGMAVENCFDGKFVYNYVNKDGTAFDGTFTTINFRIDDMTMTSTVLYLSVTSLDDNNLVPISYTTANGIVTNTEAVAADQEEIPDYKSITLELSDKPVPLDALGITDIQSCAVENGQILIIEDGELTTLEPGSTMVEFTFSDGSVKNYLFKINLPEETSETAEESLPEAETAEENTEEEGGLSVRTILIIIAVIAALIALVLEYIIIMKPFARKSAAESPDTDEEETEEQAEDGQEYEEVLSAAEDIDEENGDEQN